MGTGYCTIQVIRPKLILNPNLVKSRLCITYSSAIQSFPNFFQTKVKPELCVYDEFPTDILYCIASQNLMESMLHDRQIAKFRGPTWGPPGPCRPQMGPMLAQWILLSGEILHKTPVRLVNRGSVVTIDIFCNTLRPVKWPTFCRRHSQLRFVE